MTQGAGLPGGELLEALLVVRVVGIDVGDLDAGTEGPGLVDGPAGWGLDAGDTRLVGTSCTGSDAQKRCALHVERVRVWFEVSRGGEGCIGRVRRSLVILLQLPRREVSVVSRQAFRLGQLGDTMLIIYFTVHPFAYVPSAL